MGAPAPVVSHQAAVCRDLVDHPGPVRQVQHDRTGVIVRPTKSLAKMTRGRLAGAATTNRSRVLSAASWPADAGHRRRLRCLRQQTSGCFTRAVRLPSQGQGRLVVRCAHEGVDGPLGRAGHEPGGLERRPDHQPGWPTPADGHV